MPDHQRLGAVSQTSILPHQSSKASLNSASPHQSHWDHTEYCSDPPETHLDPFETHLDRLKTHLDSPKSLPDLPKKTSGPLKNGLVLGTNRFSANTYC